MNNSVDNDLMNHFGGKYDAFKVHYLTSMERYKRHMKDTLKYV